jgi:hypothetical protein
MGIGLKKEIVFFFIIEKGIVSLLMKMPVVIAVKGVGFLNDSMPYFIL